jgi:hypothetical protein
MGHTKKIFKKKKKKKKNTACVAFNYGLNNKFLLTFCITVRGFFFSRTKIKTFADQKWPADQTLGNTELDLYTHQTYINFQAIHIQQI